MSVSSDSPEEGRESGREGERKGGKEEGREGRMNGLVSQQQMWPCDNHSLDETSASPGA